MRSLINLSLMLQVVGKLRVACELKFGQCFILTSFGNCKIYRTSSAVCFAVYVEIRCKPRETVEDVNIPFPCDGLTIQKENSPSVIVLNDILQILCPLQRGLIAVGRL